VHILGLLNIVTAVAAGSRIRLHPRFDLDASLRAIAEERMTLEMAVAPIALGMANHPHLEDFDLSSLRYIMWGATPVAEEVARTVSRRTGVRWLPAYGTSEVPVIAANPVQDPERWRLDSAGLAAPGVEIRIADPETGAVLDPGSTGEIEVRSRSAMAGYLPDSETAAAFHDSWYRTGDIGWLEPEGWLHITDRLKEMIKVRGFQVAPAELEAVLHGDPRVHDCAVFGVDDAELGEAIVAAVVLAPGTQVSPEELQAVIADRLAGYKRVRHVVMVDAIPRLPSGKALRRQLKEAWISDRQ
jgi:acyl-CoA synthetase (AMP-forming)/AMP-acid ligase II